jgi:cyclopropane fatty-acyl-phospholipid synthase-like methyltransferase
MFAPSTARNRAPILEVLARVVPEGARVLEIASGAGEHAVWLAEHLRGVIWVPSDPDAEARASIDGWRAHTGLANVLPPLALDVSQSPWPLARADVVVCLNMIHISPWEATEALIAGASAILARGGVLYTYGPYRRGGAHTAPSNEAFDASLRARNPAWGVRDLEAVESTARAKGFVLEEIVEMPSNNLSLVFRKG